MDLAQISWRSLLMGDGTPYVVQSVSGLQDSPGVRSGRTPRGRAHGSFPGPKYSEHRVITATIEIDGPHQNGPTVWDDFSRAHITAIDELGEFHAKVSGVASGREVVLFATCEKLSLPVDQDYWQGLGHADVQWVADDPRIYDAVLSTVSTTVADTSGTGEPWPFDWPIDWGGTASGGTVTATNEGEFPAPWVATITGPVTSPRIEDAATGQVVRFDGSLAAGETLVVDSMAKSVLLGGTVSRYSWLRPQSRWFDLAPGANTIRFAASAGSGSLTLSWRSCWI